MRLARAASVALAAALAACAGPPWLREPPGALEPETAEAVEPAGTSASAEPATAGGEAGDDRDGDADAPARTPAGLEGEAAPSREPAAASPGARHAADPEDPASAAQRERLVALARGRLGRPAPRLDCSGFVLAVYRDAGIAVRLAPARSRSESLLRASRPVVAPHPGDLAFFHDTYDRDRNHRGGDRFTHVALVESVEGTALTLLHRGGSGVERFRMDLARPSDPAANDPVRVRRRADAPSTRYLAGELFAAFGALLGGDVTQMLQARRPGVSGGRHPAQR